VKGQAPCYPNGFPFTYSYKKQREKRVKPIKVGVIGLGLIWLRVHKPILATMGDIFQPVAFCDVSEQRRAETAAAFPGALVLSDYQSLLQLPEVEAVLVLTPIAYNAPIALAALAAGKDVIMEKPIARSVAEGQQLLAAAQQAGRRLFVLEQLAYRQGEGTLAKLLADGEIGDLMLWERVQHLEADTAQGALRYDSTAWRKAGNFPLGALFDGGIHIIASLAKVFGQPVTASATGQQLRPDYGEYDHVVMMFQYASGAVGLFSHSAYLAPLKNYFYIHGQAGVIVVEPHQLLVQKPNQPDRVIPLASENAYTTMWQALAHAWQTGTDPYYTAAKALADVATLAAVDQSIKTGQRIQISAIAG